MTTEASEPVYIRDKWGEPVKFYDDRPFDDCRVFVCSDSLGLVGVIRARNESEALEIWSDEFKTPIEADEVAEAFDPKSPEELLEGYEFQANSTGSGIVNVDLNGEYLNLLTFELADRFELTLVALPNIDD